jgi:hypothetical protein
MTEMPALDVYSFGLTSLKNAPLLENLETLSIITSSPIDLADLKNFLI